MFKHVCSILNESVLSLASLKRFMVGEQGWGARLGRKGWCSGESACLLPIWPGFKSPRRHHMWVEVVVGSERFFSGYSSFPLSSKTNTSKFQFDQESGRQRTTLGMCYLQIIIIIIIIITREAHITTYPGRM